MVERQLPKLHTRVRFPSPAPTGRCSEALLTGSVPGHSVSPSPFVTICTSVCKDVAAKLSWSPRSPASKKQPAEAIGRKPLQKPSGRVLSQGDPQLRKCRPKCRHRTGKQEGTDRGDNPHPQRASHRFARCESRLRYGLKRQKSRPRSADQNSRPSGVNTTWRPTARSRTLLSGRHSRAINPADNVDCVTEHG